MEKNTMYMLSIVAIVAVVAVVVLTMGDGFAIINDSSSGDLSGQAVIKIASSSKGSSGSSSSSTSCTDTDGGSNLNVVGTTSGGVGTYANTQNTDSCFSGQLKEWYCISNQQYFTYSNCPSGSTCNNGACVAPSACTDSDGGQNTAVQGTTSGGGSMYANTQNTDSCVSTNRVREWYCNAQTNSQIYSTLTCSPGYYNCNNGACVAPPACTDSDDGQNTAVQGTTIGQDASAYNAVSTHTDSCFNQYTLVEGFCNPNTPSVRNTQQISCTALGKTCQNGACV